MKTASILPALVLAVALWSCGTKADKPAQQAAPEEAVVPVKLTRVESVVRAESVVASGLVSSAEEARLSFKIGGILNKTFVEEGQTVRKGQLLATLDLTEIAAQVQQAQLAAEKSDRDLARVKALYADTAATLEQVQNVTTGRNVAQQALTIARFNQSYAQVRATVDGTVTRKLVNEGELVNPGSPVYIVSGNRQNDWIVRVGVSDKDWARLKLGNRAVVTLDAYPGQTFTGTVSELAQAADPLNKLYEVEVRLNPNGAKLAPGLFAKVTLQPAQTRSYAVVPVEAIVEGNGKEGFVYTLTDDRKHVRKVPVQIGFLDGSKVLLSNGLTGTAEVVSAGSAYLTEQSIVVLK